jgi:hypothetical protein
MAEFRFNNISKCGRAIAGVTTMLGLSLLFNNCSSKFNMKRNFLKSNNVLSENVLATTQPPESYGDPFPPFGTNPTVPVTGGTPGPSPSATPTSMDSDISVGASVSYMCSDDAVKKWQGYSLMTANDSMKITFIQNGVLKCEIKGSGIREKLINEKKIEAKAVKAACPGLMAGSYQMFVVRESAGAPFGNVNLMGTTAKGSEAWAKSARAGVDVNVGIENSGAMKVTTQKELWLLYSSLAHAKSNGMKQDCDSKETPLVIQLAPSHRPAIPLTLTAPLEGILYDILGARNFHRKNRISWITRESANDNYFLALPNARGEVNGIDELFGNNTMGPDRGFAAHGFEALSKYDNVNDGYIDRKDAVFSRLRMWSDRSVDGIAQANELFSLSQLGVESIDLNYDPSYREQDKYGNEVNLKSVAVTRDGRAHPVYDVWFRVLPN